MTEDHVGNSIPYKANIKPTTTTTIAAKKKLRGWEKVRDEVTHDGSSSSKPSTTHNGTFLGTIPTNNTFKSSTSMIPSSSSSPAIHHQRKFNPFQRTPDPSLANTTLAAAQAAGMTNFTRNFRPPMNNARHNNGIYATTTAVQQDIYKLERELDKLLQRVNARAQNSSFVETTQSDPNKSVESINNTNKKGRFARQSVTDMFSSEQAQPIHENITVDEALNTRFILSSIMEILSKHKSATRLPLTTEIFAILGVPFDKAQIDVQECVQALDLFEYIRNRFKLLDSAERFEQVIFCTRLLDSGDINIKTRVFNILDDMLLPCVTNVNYLPSSPTSFHSLVYTLTNALSQLDPKRETSIRSGVLDILDRLSQGSLIALATHKDWSSYHSNNTTPPISVAQYCVLEGLCKYLSMGMCSQMDPYQGVIEQQYGSVIERASDRVIIQELLPRYWPSVVEISSRPAFYKVIYLITDLSCETFLSASADDLKVKTSTASLLLPFVVEKLAPSKLQDHLEQRDTDETQTTVTFNVMMMLLSLLSITSLQDTTTSRTLHGNYSPRSSPNLSPQISMQDMALNDSASFAESMDQKSIASLVQTTSPAVQQTIMTLKGYISEFWKSGYKEFILKATESMHQDASGERVARIYQNLVFYIDPVMGEEIAKATIPSLFKRLRETTPPVIPALSSMLIELSKRFKPIFYKPIVSCVASDEEEKVSNILTLLACLRRYMSGVQYWMQDAEMINVLLLSNVGSKKKEENPVTSASTPQLKINDAPHEPRWGHTTLGQCAIASEFMWCVKELRDKQSDKTRNMEEDEIAKKFLIDLERRLSVFLTAKEKTTLVPVPLRVILCNIFMDIRFYCFTTHRPGWLTRTIDWAIQPVASTPEHPFHPFHGSPFEDNMEESKLDTLHMGHLEQTQITFERIRGVYVTMMNDLKFETLDTKDYSNYRLTMQPVEPQQDTSIPRHKRQQLIATMYPISRNDAIALDLDPPVETTEGNNDSNSNGPAYRIAKYKFDNLENVKQDPFGAVFSLLAAVFTTLSSQEFGRLVRPLWDRFIDDRKPESFIPAAFLLLQCGEKIPKVMIEVSTHDFYSGDPLRRLSVIQKHFTLSAFRFNVLSQEYIPISSRKRPFRGDGGAFSTPFVPTDLGSNQFSLDEPRWMSKLKSASNFPLELKRQIQELGWDDDDQGEEQEAMKKVLTPLALLPSLFLEEEDERLNEDENTNTAIPSYKPPVNISKIIGRRKRATTIQSMTISFLSMVDLLNDDYGGASNALRELLQYFLRDDPSLFLRPFLSDLGKFKLERHRDMFTRIRYLVSMQYKLPPGFAHILFNYLAGMLKWLARESKRKDEALVLMTLIHPILAELILSTNDLSIRDLRKNKIEHLLISTGRFWFTHEQPMEMFPRYLSSNRTPFSVLDIPLEIFSVTMTRLSHIQFLTNYLTRYPREVYAVKKTLQDYEPTPIPGGKSKAAALMNENYFFPDMKQRQRSLCDEIVYRREASQQQIDTTALSSLRARLWLRFIDNLLNGLNKNYNDRNELERILMGINTIITEHDDDFGIIGQTLILYTRVVTRFKRLFISNRGYTTFLRALFKVFCQVDCYPQVRSAILFSWCRFYAVHEESFVFQMLGTLVPTILNAYVTQSDELGNWMLDNLYILMETMNDPPHLGATSDTLGLQLQVELDDHERSIQERIDAVSNPLAMPLSNTILKPLARSVTTPILPLAISNYNNRAFELQNFIKLFLTVIAYDPGSLRAEQFVKIFKKLIPKFSKSESLAQLLDEGIVALVDVFTKFSKNAKPTAATATETVGAAATSASTNQTTTGHNSAGGLGISTPGAGGSHNQGIPIKSATTTTAAGGINDTNTQRADSAQQAYGKQWQQNDRLSIKKEFVLLVHEYLKCGGTLTDVYHEKMANIIKMVMRDFGTIKGLICPTDWIKDYLIDCLHSMIDIRNNTKSFKRVLHQIFIQYRVQWKTVDGADLFHGLALVLEQGQGKAVAMHDIAGVMREKFIPFGLMVSTRYDWEDDHERHRQFSNSVVRLIIAILENSTQDVIYEIEQQVPSPNLMSFIVIPICLQYNLQWDYSNLSISSKFRPDPTSNWTRLLGFVSRACSQASLLKNKSTGFSLSQLKSGGKDKSNAQDSADALEFPDLKDSKQTPQTVALLFSLCFIAIKVILVRGAKSFDKISGSWAQVAFFSRNALAFGQSLKFLKSKSSGSGRSSPNNVSPALSPVNWTTSHPTSLDNRPVFSFTAPIGNNTIYDFTTWRFLEFVIYYRSPLFVFLKDFIYDKLAEINGSGSGSGHHRSSLYTPSPIASNFGPPSPFSQTTTNKSSNISRWKSWGGPSIQQQQQQQSSTSYSPSGMIPQVNIQEADDNNYLPTQGLGLHIPTTSNRSSYTPPVPSSPSLDLPDQQQWNTQSRTSTSTHPSIQNNNNNKPFESEDISSSLHLLHAESITSVVNIQLAMGFKPALPWMAGKPRQQLKPWDNREAVSRMSNEWQLLTQLDTDEGQLQKMGSNNMSNSFIPSTPH
ncbi:hypothetical protein K501DRAFT_233277 [Backusella circina FSU 941]|nr:hypothetical protein K501DRAFT_233277 [Backusella circina FSU 941]